MEGDITGTPDIEVIQLKAISFRWQSIFRWLHSLPTVERTLTIAEMLRRLSTTAFHSSREHET
jgi:hypothetical protein